MAIIAAGVEFVAVALLAFLGGYAGCRAALRASVKVNTGQPCGCGASVPRRSVTTGKLPPEIDTDYQRSDSSLSQLVEEWQYGAEYRRGGGELF